MKRRIAATGAVVLSLAAGGAALAQPAPSPQPIDGQTMNVRVRDTRTKVNEVQSSVRRMRDRLKLLEEQMTGTLDGPARAEIVVKNDMSGAYLLTSVRVVVDDTLAYAKEDANGLTGPTAIPAFAGPIGTGDHVVHVTLRYRGSGAVLPYMRAYTIELSGDRSFTATARHTSAIVVDALEQGGPLTPFLERPAISWSEQTVPPPSAPRESPRR